MTTKRKTGPTSLAAILSTSAELSPAKGRIDGERWSQLVGDRVAARTRVGSIQNGTLTVHAASAVWAQELTFLAPTILERLRGAGFTVEKLRFRVSDVGQPAPRRAAPTRGAPPPEKAPKAALPPELLQRLARLEDPLLRAAIAEAASYSIGRADAPTSERPATRAPRPDASRSAPPARAGTLEPGVSKDTRGKRSR
jgi:hypothetical protein